MTRKGKFAPLRDNLRTQFNLKIIEMKSIIRGKENPTDQKPQKETGNRKLKRLVQFQEKERRSSTRASADNATVNPLQGFWSSNVAMPNWLPPLTF